MNRFPKAPRDNFEFGGNLSYFSLCLTDNLSMTNFLHYPPTFKWAKCLTSNMFSEASRGQIKKVMIFALWFGMNSYGLVLFLHADVVWWIDVCSFTYKLRKLECRVSDQNIVGLIFLTFSFKGTLMQIRKFHYMLGSI